MRHRSFILLAALLGILIFGSFAVYAVDAGQQDKIAEGVTIAGVDVGGLKRDEAERVVTQRVRQPLKKAVTVEFGRRTFKLPPEQATAKADVNAMVDDAMHVSRKGSIVSRAIRSLTGAELDEDVAATLVYDHSAVGRLVARVGRRLERPPANAKLKFSGGALRKVRGKRGVTVRKDTLRDAIGGELAHPTPDRVVQVPVSRPPPKVGVRDLPRKYPVVVTIDRDSFKLRLYKRLRRKETYPIAVGQSGLETPAGLYHVQTKVVNPSWHVPDSSWAGDLAGRVIPYGSPDNPLKARWLGIHEGAGIHGTADIASLGEAASHGCIRMSVRDVKKLYREVPLRAPVFIA
jgi:lipoprotein-anchoring transpeptidase ErfK/SrfK